jgi:ABC-type phosphate/phosphonate transport system permease subunit
MITKGKKMDKLKDVTKFKNIAKILFWLVFLVFFIYSFQSIMDFEEVTNPHRQESFIRILTALSKPNFVESETSRQVAEKMWETFQIAFLATVISAILAIPFTCFSARPSSF